MKKRKIYLDTSVISHLDAPDAPEKMRDTIELWKMLESGLYYDVVLSSVVLVELEECQQPKRSNIAKRLANIRYELITIDDGTVVLASKFVDIGVLSAKSIDDCRHIAVALISGCDIIASWNFKHIVNIKTIEGVKKIAVSGGYNELLICTPSMLI